MFRGSGTPQKTAETERAVSQPKEAPSAIPQGGQGMTEAAARQPVPAKPDRPGRSGGRTDWRVVAFTYNQESQAQKKASWLLHNHPDMQPEVFSPTGGAPWLVTLGGTMQRDDAYALAKKARSLGLPHDTYAQNYTAR